MKKNLIIALSIIFSNTYAQVGINTDSPTNTLDVKGDARIQSINTLTTKPTYVLTPDANGVVSQYPTSNFLTTDLNVPTIVAVARRTTDYSYSSGSSIVPIVFDDVVLTNDTNMNYNSTTGAFTAKVAGIYQVTFQIGVTGYATGTDMILGVTNSSRQWIGRATFSYPTGTGTGRQFTNYITTLSFKAGDVFYMGFNANSNMTVAGNQTGSTGTGNLTNVTVIKYQ